MRTTDPDALDPFALTLDQGLHDDDSVTWFCSYTPVEIITAAGLKPVRMLGDSSSTESADTLLHSNICPYVRSCLQSAESDPPDSLIFTDTCDALLRLHDAWNYYHCPAYSHLLGVPRHSDDIAKRAYRDAVEGLLHSLERYSGNRVSSRRLLESFELWEEVRKTLRSISRMAMGEECVLKGSSLMRVFLASQVMEPRSFLESARNILSERIPKVHQGRNSKRVLLLGNMLRPDGLPELIENCGGEIVVLDLCCGERFAAERAGRADTPGGTMRHAVDLLADYYLERSPCPRMADRESRLELLGRRIDESSPSGVIYAPLMFCDSFFYEYPILRDHLAERGMPLLFLESDYRDENIGQLRTRIEAFLEMI